MQMHDGNCPKSKPMALGIPEKLRRNHLQLWSGRFTSVVWDMCMRFKNGGKGGVQFNQC